MMTKLDERLAIADLYYRLIERIRLVARVAPDSPQTRCGQVFCDREGRWWAFTAEACRSEDEAMIVVGRLEDEHPA